MTMKSQWKHLEQKSSFLHINEANLYFTLKTRIFLSETDSLWIMDDPPDLSGIAKLYPKELYFYMHKGISTNLKIKVLWGFSVPLLFSVENDLYTYESHWACE